MKITLKIAIVFMKKFDLDVAVLFELLLPLFFQQKQGFAEFQHMRGTVSKLIALNGDTVKYLWKSAKANVESVLFVLKSV